MDRQWDSHHRHHQEVSRASAEWGLSSNAYLGRPPFPLGPPGPFPPGGREYLLSPYCTAGRKLTAATASPGNQGMPPFPPPGMMGPPGGMPQAGSPGFKPPFPGPGMPSGSVPFPPPGGVPFPPPPSGFPLGPGSPTGMPGNQGSPPPRPSFGPPPGMGGPPGR